MALQISYNSQYGFTAPAAYVRIESFAGGKDTINVNVQYFYDAAARTDQQPIGYNNFQLEIENGATMADMYTALKALPEFTGSTDC